MTSRKDREKVLKAIIDYERNDPHTSVTYPSKTLEATSVKDVFNVLQVLVSEKLIKFDRVFDHEGIIILSTTHEGYSYFEREADNRREFWRHSVLVPIGVTIVTTLIIQYLIPWIISLLASVPPAKP